MASRLGLGRRLPWLALAVLLAVLLVSNARAAQAGDSLTVSVLTMGPGDHPFSRFGHIAIAIEDEDGPDLVYNYGTFSFESPTLVSDFLRGRLRYWLSVDRIERTVASYSRANRSVVKQELELSPEQKRRLAELLAHNARPENREYLYDYYRDNCSTRVRDVLDRVLGGALRRASQAPASLSYREHTRRLTADDLPLFMGLDVLTGPLVDAPIRRWDEAFLPDQLAMILRDVRVPTPSGEKPLVRRETVLVRAERAPLRDEPPRYAPYFAVLGIALGAGLAALGLEARRSRAARVALGVALGAFGLLAGALGLIFAYFWLGTNHEFGHRNANLLLCSPHLLGLIGAGVAVARGSVRGAKVAVYLLAASLLASLLGAAGLWPQKNYEIAALFLPLWLGLGSAAALVARTRTTP